MAPEIMAGQNISNARYERLTAVGYGALAIITGIAMTVIENSSYILAYRAMIPSMLLIELISVVTVSAAFLCVFNSSVANLFESFNSTIVSIYFFAALFFAPELVVEILVFLIKAISLGIYAPHLLIGAPLIFICYERIKEHWEEADIFYKLGGTLNANRTNQDLGRSAGD